MLRADKERIVGELAERLKGTSTLFVADYRGLSVTEIDDLRTKVLEHGGRFTVVKNTLTKRAAEEAGAEALLALLDGPTAIAFIEADGDMVAVAKALADSERETKILAIRGGILDGSPIGIEEVKNLATLPPVDVLRGQVIGAITAPLVTVVGLISAPIRDLLGLIDARIAQLEAEGDTPAAEPAPAEPAAEAEEAGTAPEGAPEEPAAEEDAPEEPIAEKEEPPAEAANEETTPEEPEAAAEAAAEAETEIPSEEAADAASSDSEQKEE